MPNSQPHSHRPTEEFHVIWLGVRSILTCRVVVEKAHFISRWLSAKWSDIYTRLSYSILSKAYRSNLSSCLSGSTIRFQPQFAANVRKLARYIAHYLNIRLEERRRLTLIPTRFLPLSWIHDKPSVLTKSFLHRSSQMQRRAHGFFSRAESVLRLTLSRNTGLSNHHRHQGRLSRISSIWLRHSRRSSG